MQVTAAKSKVFGTGEIRRKDGSVVPFSFEGAALPRSNDSSTNEQEDLKNGDNSLNSGA